MKPVREPREYAGRTIGWYELGYTGVYDLLRGPNERYSGQAQLDLHIGRVRLLAADIGITIL